MMYGRRCFRNAALLTLTLLTARVQAGGLDTLRRWQRPNVLKTNLLAPVSLFYERAVGDRFALRVSGRWLSGKRLVFEESSFVNATIEGKLYTARTSQLRRKPHPTGFFVNPYLKARSLRYVQRIGYGFNKEGDRDEMVVNSIGAGLTIGYQWVSQNGVAVELFCGPGTFLTNRIRHTMRYSNVISSPNDYLNIDFRIGASLGYAF